MTWFIKHYDLFIKKIQSKHNILPTSGKKSACGSARWPRSSKVVRTCFCFYNVIVSDHYSLVILEYYNVIISDQYSLVIFEYYNVMISEHYSLVIFEYYNVIISERYSLGIVLP